MKPTRQIQIFVNREKYALDDPTQTGAQLKALAGIPPSDVLFLQRPREDQVITNDCSVTLRNGARLHSQPPADYGNAHFLAGDSGLSAEQLHLHHQPGGWTFLVVDAFALPEGYDEQEAKLLVKLPPTFPDAAPDMFWLSPAVRTSQGALPRATTTENLLGAPWQRFSWHLAKGAWKPGTSTLRDFIRCVHARLLRRD